LTCAKVLFKVIAQRCKYMLDFYHQYCPRNVGELGNKNTCFKIISWRLAWLGCNHLNIPVLSKTLHFASH
jgi:hypothetical protein